ncbi:unnamed protein product [Penicillium palitans]
MDPVLREALKHTRTIFLSDGQPHYEDLSTLPEMWWVSVKLFVEDRLLADEELMDLVAACCRDGECEELYISFPVMNCDQDLTQRGWVLMVVGLAEHYRLEIAAGRLSVDRDYIFEPRA